MLGLEVIIASKMSPWRRSKRHRYEVVNLRNWIQRDLFTVYPNKYAHGFCFAVLYCGYTLTDFPISIRLTSLALWQSNDCPSASKATVMNMDNNFMWIHYERLRNQNKAKHNKTVCIFLGIYCIHQSEFHTELNGGRAFLVTCFLLWLISISRIGWLWKCRNCDIGVIL